MRYFHQITLAHFPLLPLLSYLKSNYKTKITSVLLEKQFHHNFDYMNRKFKEVTGETIFAFLEKYRIEQAKILLSMQTVYCNADC